MKNDLRFRGRDSVLAIVIRLWSGRPRSDGSIPCGKKEHSVPKVVTQALEST
jgi:hypothetical protein